MGDDKEPNGFERPSGDRHTGPQTGGILSVIIASGAGYYFGGLAGAGLGLVGGALLAPLINNLLHQITGGKMPERPGTIARGGPSLTMLPGEYRTPKGTYEH